MIYFSTNMQKKNPKVHPGRTRKRTLSADTRFQQHRLSEPFRQRLSNGITLVGESIPTVESVAIGVWVNFGSRDEKPDENGLTHLIEHMVFKGTSNFSAAGLVGAIENRGGYINAFTTKECSCYYAKVFKHDVEESIRVLADLVIRPVFGNEDLENERKVVLSELQEVYDDPEDWGMDFLEEKIFAGNALSMPIIGTPALLRRYNVDDLREFHRKNFTADRLVISVAGNFERAELVALATKYFSALPPSSRFFIRRKPKQCRSDGFTIRRGYGRQAHILLGTRAPGLNDPDRFAASMAGVILGDGSSSRLYKNVREKDGLAYSIYSFGSGYADSGLAGVYACTAVEDAALTEDRVFETIDEFVRNGPTDEEVERSRAQLKAGIIFALENLWDRATLFARDELYYMGRSDVSESLESIEKTTGADIAAVVKKYLTREKLTSVKILPQKKEKKK